jgi:diadenosine tetraphosphate (Ap4A) HIT family hydrolase
MTDCLFCRIIAGELPSKQRHSSDLVIAIEDIAPQAPLHLLILPREHIGSAADLRDTPAHAALLARMHAVAVGQAIEHLHYHLLAGRQLSWPPG